MDVLKTDCATTTQLRHLSPFYAQSGSITLIQHLVDVLLVIEQAHAPVEIETSIHIPGIILSKNLHLFTQVQSCKTISCSVKVYRHGDLNASGLVINGAGRNIIERKIEIATGIDTDPGFLIIKIERITN